MHGITVSRKGARSLLTGAAFLLVGSVGFAGQFTARITDLQISHTLLYPGQDIRINYTLSGSGIGATGISPVKIEFLKNGTVAKTVLYNPGENGAKAGPNSVSIPVAGLDAGGPYTVRVSTTGNLTFTDYTRVSDPADPNVQFISPRGLDVNRNAGSPAVGRIYITEGTGGATRARTVVDGVYALNPDLTPAFDTVKFPAAEAGWTASSHSPFRVYVAPDSTVFVTDAADAHPFVFFTDPDLGPFTPLFATTEDYGVTRTSVGQVKNADGIPVFGDTTSIWVEGSGATRKVFAAIQEIPDDPVNNPTGPNGLNVWVYNIADGESNVVQIPTLVANPPASGTTSWYADFVRDAQGNVYITNYSTNDVWKYDSTGTLVSTISLGIGATGIAIDEARDIILISTVDGQVLKTNKEFAAVTPIITALGSISRDVAMDREGWIYVANDGALHVYAPAGTYPAATASADAPQTLTIGSTPLSGDIAPVGPSGLYLGINGQRYGDGKVDILDSVYNLRVAAGLNPLP